MDKLTIYDIIGILVPGFLGLYAFYLISITFFSDLINIGMTNDIITGAIYLFLLLFSGVILHECGEILQKYIFMKLWNGFPSQRFLIDEDETYPKEIKDKLKAATKECFSLEFQKFGKMESQKIFDLYYTKLQSLGKDDRAQILNAQYGMIRSFIAGTLLLVISYSIITISTIFNKGLGYAKYDLFITLIGAIILYILARRLGRFGSRFADYIIRGFYIYYTETKESAEKPLSTPIVKITKSK